MLSYPAFFFFFDTQYILMVLLPGMLLSGIASAMVQSAFHKYSQVRSYNGYTGAQAAQALLDGAGITDVTVVPVQGMLTDHYNPVSKQLALSPMVHNSNSIAAIGVACHEAGHAIQHAHGYAPLWLRSMLVPAAKIGSSLGIFVMLAGLIFLGGNQMVIMFGAILFSGVVLFQLITLPVEFDASARAKKLVVEAGIIYPEERTGVDKVLNAAALTYVAAAISSILTLLYFLMRSGILGGSRN